MPMGTWPYKICLLTVRAYHADGHLALRLGVLNNSVNRTISFWLLAVRATCADGSWPYWMC